jgi:hypothetical protein
MVYTETAAAGDVMKRMVTLLAVLAVFGLMLPGTALAKDKKKKGEVTEFLKPEVGFVGLIQQEKAASLIKIRDDFVDEIVRSAEDL